MHKSFIFKVFCLFLITIGLNACGYQPLHGKRATNFNTEMQDELANIWVYEIEDRPGQILHNELLTLFNTKGRPQKPKYKLKVVFSESSSGLGISKDEFATRANLTTNAAFTLSGPISLTGQSQSVVSYNILASPTGTEFAKRDAELRAIKNMALDIHRRIAVHILNAKQPQK